MSTEKLKTRQEVANELGISYKTLLRKLKNSNVEITSGILTFDEIEKIKNLFGIKKSDVS
jgi:transcriptional antiterminator